MKLVLLGLVAFLVASPRTGAGWQANGPVEQGFVSSAVTFADEAACRAHVAGLVAASARPAWDIATGPYSIAAGDVRAHRVKARDWGHEIEEFRCLGAKLETRSWTHSLNDVKPITVEDIGRMSFPE